MLVRNRLTLVCDTCGEELPTEIEDATELRTFAAVKGWQYRTFRIKNPGPQKQGYKRHPTVKRTWDGCPSCPVPESGDGMLTSAEKQYGARNAVVEQPR